jgi:hypothetical protein
MFTATSSFPLVELSHSPTNARLFRIGSDARKRLNLREFATTLPLEAAGHVICTDPAAISFSSANAQLAICLPR